MSFRAGIKLVNITSFNKKTLILQTLHCKRVLFYLKTLTFLDQGRFMNIVGAAFFITYNM